MNRIVVQNLTKDFFTLRRGRVRALQAVDLSVEPGTFFVLVGPSGCGKSTLLSIVAGIEKPTEGEIWIGERQVVSTAQRRFLPPRQRDIAMVFQSYALYPHLTVYANIAFPLKIAKTDPAETDRRVRQAADILEITALLDARPAELSGGQRQRVALGRAIVRRPQLLLLDEPLSNLDALLRTSMRGELKQIQRRLGVTTLYVTHDQTEAMALGDRIAVLKDGIVQQTGTPADIFHRPANRFVARFIGTPPMNLLDGRLLEKAQHAISIPGIEDVSRVQLGLRPEHLKITGAAEGIWRARLALVSSLGSEAVLYLDLAGCQVLARAAHAQGFQENQQVGISFDMQHLFVFEKEGGRRLQ
jgi:multiple sugar transport system ATP-binding protein